MLRGSTQFKLIILTAVIGVILTVYSTGLFAQDVPLYKVFEQSVTNNNSYGNKFYDVTLNVTYTHPSSGKTIDFWGFFDGDGNGGGNPTSGNVWKMRFMPDELGTWNYTYTWTDSTPGGSGSFNCVADGAGKGILKPYNDNPRWFAYNGTEPMYLKNALVCAAMNHELGWTINNIYQPLINRGYNGMLFYILLPTGHPDDKDGTSGDYWMDTSHYTWFLLRDNDPINKMKLERWKIVDEHCKWLNDNNVAMFMHGDGFTGKDDYVMCNFNTMSSAQQHFFVKYTMARLAPLAMMVWNYSWECDWTWSSGMGDGWGIEKVCMELVEQYDPWDHMRTAHNGAPDPDDFEPTTYTYAAIESREGHGCPGDASTQRHSSCGEHNIVLDTWGYSNKPVFQQEGHGFWNAWGRTDDTTRRCAWANFTAAGSFSWGNVQNRSYTSAIFSSMGDEYVDILTDVIENNLEFWRMVPRDDLISNRPNDTFCLAEEGVQYCIYDENGGSFTINLTSGSYEGKWINTRTGGETLIGSISGGGNTNFSSPNTSTDWVLLLTAPPIAAPSNLNATAVSSNEIHLSWQDNSSNPQETGFIIERKPYQNDDAWHEIARVTTGVTSYTDTQDLYGNVTYTYHVGAYTD